jgi:predicted RNase H-like HicB family nuclease
MPNYRVLLQFDPEKNVYVARAPELEHCTAEGATRAEAIAKVEEEIQAQLDNMRERGGHPPAAVDDPGAEFSGEITAKVSKTLQRELVFQAKAEGIELGQLLSEMLPHALDARRRERRRVNPQAGPEREERGERYERGGGRADRGAGRGQGGRYYAIMEDKATFLEYVRGLDSGGGQRQPPRDDRRGGRRGGRGPGGPGGAGSGSGQGGPGSGSDDDGNT